MEYVPLYTIVIVNYTTMHVLCPCQCLFPWLLILTASDYLNFKAKLMEVAYKFTVIILILR